MEAALRGDLNRVRQRVLGVRADTTTPDTRLADDPMHLNPCSASSLIHLMLGGIHPKHQGNVLQCRLRYFDPLRHDARFHSLVDRVGFAAARDISETSTLINLD